LRARCRTSALLPLDDLDAAGSVVGPLDVVDGLGGEAAVGDVGLGVLYGLLQRVLVTVEELQGHAGVLGPGGALVSAR
jgi:hypothetical protein